LPLVAWFANERDGGSVLHARSPGSAELWGEVRVCRSADTAVQPFGYRWEAGRWHPVEPAALGECAVALPDIWTTDSTVDTICALAGTDDEGSRAAAVTIVCAAEIGAIPRTIVDDIFRDTVHFDVDNAMSQLAMAGIPVTGPGISAAGPLTVAGSGAAALPALALGAHPVGPRFPVPVPRLCAPPR
jgi:hypothetical protein